MSCRLGWVLQVCCGLRRLTDALRMQHNAACCTLAAVNTEQA